MKCRGVRAMLIAVLAGLFTQGIAQKNYYVVVGAFSTEGDAKELKTNLPVLNSDTAYAMSDDKNVVHLYVLRTTNKDVAVAKSLQLQKSLQSEDKNVTPWLESVSVSDLPEGRSVSVKQSYDQNGELLTDAGSSRTTASAGVTDVEAPASVKGKLFKFTVSDPQGQPLDGNVHLVDFKNETDIASYTTQVYTEILNPGREETDVAVVFGVFGYKQSEKSLNYSDPSLIAGAYQDENGAWVIPYKLERLTKGDVSVMYNVSFRKDAVIMSLESESDLIELVKMMKENPKYEITIHGHCNGKQDRKITGLGANTNYFSTRGSLHFYGSAKELTDLRAKAIREYLIRKGITEKRIRTFAWGGRYMLVPPTSQYAKLNDRIEIEIRKD